MKSKYISRESISSIRESLFDLQVEVKRLSNYAMQLKNPDYAIEQINIIRDAIQDINKQIAPPIEKSETIDNESLISQQLAKENVELKQAINEYMTKIKNYKSTIDAQIEKRKENANRIDYLEEAIKRQELMIEVLQTKLESEQANVSPLKYKTLQMSPNKNFKEQINSLDMQIRSLKKGITSIIM